MRRRFGVVFFAPAHRGRHDREPYQSGDASPHSKSPPYPRPLSPWAEERGGRQGPPMTPPASPAATHLLVRAARGEAVERPPVWAMRQAGRWDPEFNAVRAGLSFHEFSEDVELAAKA